MANISQKNEQRKSSKIIPQEWEVKKLKDLTTYVDYRGKTPTKVEQGVFLITARNIKEGFIDYKVSKEYVKVDDYESIMRRGKPKVGDVLITTEAPMGNVAQIDREDIALAQRVIKFRGEKGVLDNTYLKYHLLSNEFQNQLLKRAIGTTVLGIQGKELHNIKIPLPNYREQLKIASILSTWDKAIELKEKLINQKKVQKKGLMQKLLTGEERLPGFKGNWKEVQLDKVVKKTKGKAIKYVKDGKYPAIDMDYLQSGEFKNFSDEAVVFANKSDVLLLWDGSRAGKAFTGVEGSVGSTFVKLECKAINNVFLQKHMEMNELKIQRLREGSGIPHVPKDFLQYYKVCMPNIEEQDAIANVLINMDKNIDLLEKETFELKEQKKGLMQLLLTGKVRVKL
ncbi:hypothetical protein GWK91_16235 [Virgibacillus sp. MSP4-1]|uniref:restriction endonuclease subunit S n=1 Tax=Virgibacillus sp. MSP4-1 TaxID=2700081 RepID=UPI0003A8BEC3|nr:restriction endonuclease subunit S [Virgibacillus sp. MSP4-1]QHS24331.1 hypothetical protein GWK91_16235 [Virgibacillus sp. MSP4-1]